MEPQTADSACEYSKLINDSQALKSGMGAVAWAVLEMFRRGGMPSEEVEALHQQMNKYFAAPSNDECNAILRVVETRLDQDRVGDQKWY